MTVKDALQQFSTADRVAIAFLAKFVTKHKDLVKKLFEKHNVVYSENPLENFYKIVSLAGVQKDWFTNDLEDVAQDAHYFSLKGVTNSIKGFIGNAAGALSTIAAPVVTAFTGVPGAGAAASGLLTGVSNLLGPKTTPLPGITPQPPPAGTPPPDIQNSAEAITIAANLAATAEAAKDAAKAEEKKDDELTFWQKHKTLIIAGGTLVAVGLGVIFYFRWQKRNGKKG